MATMDTAAVLPNPVFEGSEKRLEVDFAPCADGRSPGNGLRAMSRDQLDELMTLAHCCIVSSRSNASFDAYVLSESSLFVYPTKWILKTCGTTRLLNSVPRLLELAGAIGMFPARVKFSRATFLFPEQQHFPHTSFDDEVEFLNGQFATVIGSPGKAYVLGDPCEGLQWHKYIAGRVPAGSCPTFNMEVCMTELGDAAARQFFRTEDFVSAAATTRDTGILALKPGADIDDYVFEPCGYSMNGIEGTGLITIHVTPEQGFSYASVEVSGTAADIGDATALLRAAAGIFHPGKVSMALSVDMADCAQAFGALEQLPAGYTCPHASVKRLECGGSVTYYNMLSIEAAEAKAPARPDSPRSILHHVASFLSTAPSGSVMQAYLSELSDNASADTSEGEAEAESSSQLQA
uniref:adenosylmethionine decarboxylase n=1 Tax=Chlamydomonas euryale TaxID=1486919 RepID=A0A7R9VAB0_9CHLO|mmetsp:Transcript_27818/g.82509  ORF Transcript_27818/g.82509 Transcript_27818/m.82509 type:complete len:406 (+) Transcript_27818:344-1561(+)